MDERPVEELIGWHSESCFMEGNITAESGGADLGGPRTVWVEPNEGARIYRSQAEVDDLALWLADKLDARLVILGSRHRWEVIDDTRCHLLSRVEKPQGIRDALIAAVRKVAER